MELHVCRKGRTDPLLFFIFWMWRGIFHGGWKTNKFYLRNPSVLLALPLVLVILLLSRLQEKKKKKIKQVNTKYFAWNTRQKNTRQWSLHCFLKYKLSVGLSMKYLPYRCLLSGQSQFPEVLSGMWYLPSTSLIKTHFPSSSSPQGLHYLLHFSSEILSLL